MSQELLQDGLRRIEMRVRTWSNTLHVAVNKPEPDPQAILAVTERLVGLIEAWEVASGRSWPPEGWTHTPSVVKVNQL